MAPDFGCLSEWSNSLSMKTCFHPCHKMSTGFKIKNIQRSQWGQEIGQFSKFLIFMQIFTNFTAHFLSENIEHTLAYLPNLYILYTDIRCSICVKISDRQACALCFPKRNVSQMLWNSTRIEEILENALFLRPLVASM